ncbi:MAG: hypothetical protein V4717_08890 [Bacteroidota bacterium]
MKKTLVVFAIFCSFKGVAQEDFVIRFNDTLINVALDKSYNIDVKGTKLNFVISSKDTLTYTNTFFSFLYPKAFRVSSTKLDEGIEQISIMTAEGSGMIIQKYESMNPTSLNEMMLTEMTKESINYGFESKRSKYKRTLKSGQEMEVTKAVLRYKDDVNIYEVSSIGKKDAGLIIITIRMDEDNNTEGQKIIDLMWKSIKVN